MGEQQLDNRTTITTIKPKYDWYETDQFVYINVLIKQMKPDLIEVQYEPNKVCFRYKQPESDKSPDYQLDLTLNGQIDPEGSSWRVIPVKAELKLKKVSNYRWSKLESQPGTAATTGITATIPMNTLSASSSTESGPTKTKSWDQYIKEVEKQEKEEEDGVEDLFKKIYSQGDEEIRKAMNKSFVESGGTVLSTNWNEVGQKKVDMKPPESCEFKKWN